MVTVDAPPIRPSAPGPATPRATADVVDVWWADLEAIRDRPEQLLCPEELARAARIVPARKRVLWPRSRGVLRALLGRYLDRDPRELRFALGPHGKPMLQEGEATGDLRFNLSHSGRLALVAVTAGREVGVDIERARPRYTTAFLHDWVLREAATKCLGTGLSGPRAGPAAAAPRTAGLDVGPDFAAAIAVEGGECELHRWDWRG
jgi:phosphopantetheinyl transferase